ncbi:retrovirus-related pol polyprotein from transposon 17.6 [Tanacetum coccineum]
MSHLRQENELEELLAKASEKLYPGCDKSTLHYLSKLLHIKVLSKWTDSSFDMLLKFLKTTYLKDKKAPSSHYEAKKTFKKIGLGYELIHACINDCCLFWKENKFEENCSVCGESRWKNKNTKGKKVPKKVLCYFPLTPRLRDMYNSIHITKCIAWHAIGKCKEDGKICHSVDGKTWKDFDQKHKQFALEPRNVRLGLAADGFNPFGNLSQGYSMWPVILTTYNMPSCYLSNWSGQGYLACRTCNKDTPSTRVLGKIAYAGHRRFLPKNHSWRKDKNFNNMDDMTDPPKTFNSANILDQLARLLQKIPRKHPDFGLIGAKRKCDLTVELNWSK